MFNTPPPPPPPTSHQQTYSAPLPLLNLGVLTEHTLQLSKVTASQDITTPPPKQIFLLLRPNFLTLVYSANVALSWAKFLVARIRMMNSSVPNIFQTTSMLSLPLPSHLSILSTLAQFSYPGVLCECRPELSIVPSSQDAVEHRLVCSPFLLSCLIQLIGLLLSPSHVHCVPLVSVTLVTKTHWPFKIKPHDYIKTQRIELANMG